jgi:hypothetical protein
VGVADLTLFGREPKILGQFFDSGVPPAIYHLAEVQRVGTRALRPVIDGAAECTRPGTPIHSIL